MSKKRTIVIANSIGVDSNGWTIIHSPSRWTNSTKERDAFTYYPWELAYTSALLKRETDCSVKFIDGCLEKFDSAHFFTRISQEEPDFLLMEPSTRTWDDDRQLMERVKCTFGTQLIVAGQHATAFPHEVARIADFVLIGEYEYTVLDIIQGKKKEDILGLYPNQRRPLLDINTLPWPEDNDVSRIQYGIPGEPSSEYLEIQAYATRGCPLNCNFCVCRHLYYHKPNWRPRSPQNVVAELKYLKDKYPQMEGIFFDEECHNIKKEFILAVTKEIIKQKLQGLKIEAMCTYCTLDEEMMYAMKEAGYYLLRIGIETAGEGAARGINLGAKFNLPKLRSCLRLAKKIGIKMYGTFTFGAPGSTQKDDQATLDLMEEIIGEGLLWRFQTSICTPQPGTPFYTWAHEKGVIKTFASKDYDGGNRVVIDYPDYHRDEIMNMYLKAQKYYDIALKNRFVTKIKNSIPLLKTFSLRTILVLRTSRMPQMEVALRTLRTVFPEASIDVIGQPGVYDELRALQQEKIIDTIYMYDHGFFSSEISDESLCNNVSEKHYDGAFIVYNNLKGRGYENVETFLNALSIENWMAFNAEGIIVSKQEMDEIRDEERTACGC